MDPAFRRSLAEIISGLLGPWLDLLELTIRVCRLTRASGKAKQSIPRIPEKCVVLLHCVPVLSSYDARLSCLPSPGCSWLCVQEPFSVCFYVPRSLRTWPLASGFSWNGHETSQCWMSQHVPCSRMLQLPVAWRHAFRWPKSEFTEKSHWMPWRSLVKNERHWFADGIVSMVPLTSHDSCMCFWEISRQQGLNVQRMRTMFWCGNRIHLLSPTYHVLR